MTPTLRTASLMLLVSTSLALGACASKDKMDDAPPAESAPAETMGEPAPPMPADPSPPSADADATPPTEVPPPPAEGTP